MCCVFLMLTGCTTFNSIEVLEPSVGMVSQTASSLKPKLSWKKLEDYEGPYDLVIMTTGKREAWYKRLPLEVVYWKNNISSFNHTVEIPLKSSSHYYWSVKPSVGEEEWAKFNYYFFGGIIFYSIRDSYFRFKTPAFSPIANN